MNSTKHNKKLTAYVHVGQHCFKFDDVQMASAWAAMARLGTDEPFLEITVNLTETTAEAEQNEED